MTDELGHAKLCLTGVTMILSTQDVNQRLASPFNLVNQLRNRRQSEGLELFTGPKSEELIEDIDTKIRTTAVKKLALDVMHESLTNLKANVGGFEKIKDLADIADKMNKIIGSDSDNGRKAPNQIVIFKPVMQEINHYESVVVNED